LHLPDIFATKFNCTVGASIYTDDTDKNDKYKEIKFNPLSIILVFPERQEDSQVIFPVNDHDRKEILSISGLSYKEKI
jgi:hypothetical protein